MTYKDYPILTEKDYQVLSQNYNNQIHNNNLDLKQILSKMKEQKELLTTNNHSGKYNNIINKIDNNIKELKSIYSSTPDTMQNTNYTLSQTLANEDFAISPTRGHYEMQGKNQPLRPLPSQPQQPTPPTQNQSPVPLPNQPIDQSTTNTPNNPIKRNRPLQMGGITSLIKSFNINNLFRKKSQPTKANHDLKQNRFHNTEHCITTDNNTDNAIHNISKYKYNNILYNNYNNTINNDCTFQKHLHYNQMDIIRLLLLYLTLHPHCRYCARITALTNSQFDILLDIDNI